MKTRIAINGFGRIGRLMLREAVKRNDVQIVAVNDLMSVEQLAYLLKYDSVHGRFDKSVQIKDGDLVVDGQQIRVTAIKDPLELKWDQVKVDVVADCTGVFKDIKGASLHIEAGAKKVLISSPSPDAPMFVMGVNEKQIKPTDLVISNASCTTNCLAPLAKILQDNFGIVEGLMTTIHAVTATQYTVDGPSKKDFRGGRSALLNIIPASTGAAKAVGKVIPEIDGKLTGMSMRVPTADVSVVDLTVKLAKQTTYEQVMQVFKDASENQMKGILSFVDEDVVSQDFVSDPHICIIDSKAGLALNSTFFKFVAWYDNEYGYSAKMLDMAVVLHQVK